MFNFPSEATMNARIEDFYQNYFSRIDSRVSWLVEDIKALKTLLNRLHESIWDIEHTYVDNSPLGFPVRLLFDMVEGKTHRPSIRPSTLARLHDFNGLVKALTEEFVLQLQNELINFKGVVLAQREADIPLQTQRAEIRTAIMRLKEAKKAALQIKDDLASSGLLRDAIDAAVEEF
jgi:hypothetical protein